MSALDEKRFTAKGKEWTARFDFNSVCDFEETTGRGFFELMGPLIAAGKGLKGDKEDAKAIAALVSTFKMSDIRAVLYTALQEAHPEVTLRETGLLIKDMGFEKAMEVASWALAKGMGEADEEEAVAAAENPPTAQAA